MLARNAVPGNSKGFCARNLGVMNTSVLDRIDTGVESTLCGVDFRAGHQVQFISAAIFPSV